MEAISPRANGGVRTENVHANQGTMKVFTKTIEVDTERRSQLINLTDQIRSFVEETQIEDGYVQISSLHTTAGIIVNEWQEALLGDIERLFERIAPEDSYYRHNDPEYSDCDRKNADSHLRNVVLGHSLSVPIMKGNLVFGRWQSVIMAEFDGPNHRRVFMQVLGI